MLTAIVFATVFGLIAIGIGRPLVRYLDADGKLLPGENICTSFILGCLPVYFLVEFVGHYRLDTESVLGIFLVSTALAVPGLRSIRWTGHMPVIRAWVADAPVAAILLAFTVLVALVTLLQGLAPPNDYDSINYHLALPKYDIELGRKGIPWDRQIGVIFLPAFGGNLTRIALVIANDGAAQIIHGLFSVAAAVGSSMLVRRLGYDWIAAILAALMFLCIRSVVWQMATVETDYLLAAAIMSCLSIYLAYRAAPGVKLAVLFGLILGSAVLIKLSAFVFAAALAPLVLYDIARRRRLLASDLLLGVVTFVVITPHLIKSYLLTGNPLYPMLPGLLAPERIATTGIYQTFEGLTTLYGTGRGLLDLVTAPWFFSVQPMHYFDGMVLGTPYLLIFCPLIFFAKNRRVWLPVLSVAFFFYVIWFFGLSQQVRYLTQIGPIATAFAGVGLVCFWKACRNSIFLKSGFAVVCTILVLNQGLFVGIYAVLRLPVAVGLVSKETFLDKTPHLTNSHFKTCDFISRNLKPGERYFSNTGSFLSYYCPQVPVVRNFFPDEAKWWLTSRTMPDMPLSEFIERVEASNIRYFMVTTHSENRRNVSGKAVVEKQDASVYRFGAYLAPALANLEPLEKDSYTAVYDAKDVIRILKSN